VGRQLSHPVSPIAAALGRRCPGCGQGKLYGSYLKVADRCTVCGLDLKEQDSGDGPAVFVIMLVGFIVVGLALVVEVQLTPPYWLHLVIWLPLTLLLSLSLLPVLKAWLIALHYRHNLLDPRPGDGE
jgi:uncharacterized protein (DUF983 family)